MDEKTILTDSAEDNDENVKYRLTAQAIMQMVLCDFGINISLTMARAICNEFMRRMVKSEHIEANKEG